MFWFNPKKEPKQQNTVYVRAFLKKKKIKEKRFYWNSVVHVSPTLTRTEVTSLS